MIRGLSHVMMYVLDLDRAVAWYGATLGFVPDFVVPGAYASLRHDAMNVRLDLHPTETAGKDVGFGPIPWFATDDIEADLARLSAAGVKVSPIRREGQSPRFATFWDSEGNALGLEEATADR